MYISDLQFAWFFDGKHQMDYEKLVSTIRSQTRYPFLSPATYIPLPPTAPQEIPRVQLMTQDNSARVDIAINRADFFIATPNTEFSQEEIEVFFNVIDTISKIFLTENNIVRLGLVARAYEDSINPTEEIAKKLLKHKYDNLQETSIKIAERYSSQKFTYNDSYQFDLGMRINYNDKHVILITRDINTAIEFPIISNFETIQEFCQLGKERLDEKYVKKILGED